LSCCRFSIIAAAVAEVPAEGRLLRFSSRLLPPPLLLLPPSWLLPEHGLPLLLPLPAAAAALLLLQMLLLVLADGL
jgi:hypothetical protein